MTEVAQVAVYTGLVLLVAKLFEDLARRAGLPGFIGAVAAGLLLGPGGASIIPREVIDSMGLLLVIGVDFLLFLAGAEELARLRGRIGPRDAAIAASILAFGTAAAALVALVIHGCSGQTAIAFGVVMAMVSLGPLVSALIDTGLISTREGSLVARVALLTEVAGILAFNTLYGGDLVYYALVTVAFFAVIYAFGRKLLTRILYLVEDYVSAREAPFAVIVALVLGASYLAELLGFNAAVTALLLGFFASEYLEERPAYLERLRAFTHGFLEPLFFAGIGLKVPRVHQDALVTTLLLVIAVAAPKLLVASASRLMPAGVALLAKGGVDAAMLLTLYESPRHALTGSLYTAGVLSMIALSVAMALGLRGGGVRGARMEPWRMRIGELGLSYDVVRRSDDLLTVSMLLSVSSGGAVVVIDEEGRPIGYITAADLIYVSPAEMKRMRADEVMREDVAIVRVTDRVTELLKEHIMAEPIVAVVDEDGRLVGTLNPSRVLGRLLGVRGGSSR